MSTLSSGDVSFDIIQMPCKYLKNGDDQFSWRLRVFTVSIDGKSVVIVGRHSTCDFKMDPPDFPCFISRRHARFDLKNERLFVKDYGSTNGTFKNCVMLSPNHEYELNSGDFIAFGCQREEKPKPGDTVSMQDTPFLFKVIKSQCLRNQTARTLNDGAPNINSPIHIQENTSVYDKEKMPRNNTTFFEEDKSQNEAMYIDGKMSENNLVSFHQTKTKSGIVDLKQSELRETDQTKSKFGGPDQVKSKLQSENLSKANSLEFSKSKHLLPETDQCKTAFRELEKRRRFSNSPDLEETLPSHSHSPIAPMIIKDDVSSLHCDNKPNKPNVLPKETCLSAIAHKEVNLSNKSLQRKKLKPNRKLIAKPSNMNSIKKLRSAEHCQIPKETVSKRKVDGMPTEEMERCSSFECRIASANVNDVISWVQCDSCDKWFHTMCVGCNYDEVKHRTQQFHCGFCEAM